MRRAICIAFAALSFASCGVSWVDLGPRSGPVVIEHRDCRAVTGKGETVDAWFLMSKDATLYCARNEYAAIRVGQEVCGPWKDKEKPAEPQRKILPQIDCSDPIPRNDPKCLSPLKS